MSQNNWTLGLPRAAIASLFVFGFFTNLLVLTIPLYMLQVFERVIGGRSVETLLFLTLAAMVALMTNSVLESIRARLLTRLAVSLENGIGGRLLSNAIVSPAQVGAASTTGIQQIRDLRELRTLLSGGGIIAALDAPWVPLFILIMFFFHPIFGMLAVAGALVLGLIVWLSEISTRSQLAQATQAGGQTLALADNFIRNAEALRSMGMARSATERWQQADLSALRSVTHVGDRLSSYGSFAKLVRMTLQILALGSGVYLVINNQLTPGIMIAGSILIARALAPLEMAIGSWRSLVSGWQAYRRLRGIVDTLDDRAPAREIGTPEGRIDVDRVTCLFPGQKKAVLNNVSLTVNPGELIAITGPSGAGKSTLANLIVGSRLPNIGKVQLDGNDVSVWGQDALSRHMGYQPQETQLFATTVGENISRLRGSSDTAAVVKAGRRAFSHEMILKLPHGYETEVGEAGAGLSGGQRRRIALARALYDDPKIVVLDEPDAFLDAEGERALEKTLQAMKRGKVSTVLITHRPELLALADKIFCLNAGVIEMSGPAETVLQRLGYRTSSPPAVEKSSKVPSGQEPARQGKTPARQSQPEARPVPAPTAEPVRVVAAPDPAALDRDRRAAAKALLKLGDFVDDARGSFGEYMVRAYKERGRKCLRHIREEFPELLSRPLDSILKADISGWRDDHFAGIRKIDSTPGRAAAQRRLELGLAALDDCYVHGVRWGLVQHNPVQEAMSVATNAQGAKALPSG